MISSLEITVPNVIVPPRPFIWHGFVLLVLNQKLLNMQLKPPKVAALLDVVLAMTAPE